ncbi:MAG: excinuclease ABC subunit UvrA [Flavobacteriaceae bacterium]|nr:excinuclease ABC subunit UvrA [Flavobacteriaceae bacterium]
MKKEASIEIIGAQMHNLKNVSVQIPRHKFVVITGLSGSGKSSLAFDTLYAEGQRRYVESLSSYARQFLGRLNKPKVEQIKGIAPAIAIEQKVISNNPRSTAGTVTEIYDYLKLLFARIGVTYSPVSGKVVKKNDVKDVLEHIKKFDDGAKLLILAPIGITKKRTLEGMLEVYKQQGYARLFVNDAVVRIDHFKSSDADNIMLVVDRVVVKHEDDAFNRIAESVETAFHEGDGTLVIHSLADNNSQHFSNRFVLDGITFTLPNEHMFSFNNPLGACTACDGYGDLIGIDEQLVIPNTSLSVFEGAVAPWKGERLQRLKNDFIDAAYQYEFPVHKPYFELSTDQKKLLWEGAKGIRGINQFFAKLEAKNYKIQNRVMLSRYRGRTKCGSCQGKRLNENASYVRVDKHTMSDLVDMPIAILAKEIANLKLTKHQQHISRRLLVEIKDRLEFLQQVGLGYLTLNRRASTLSGGESQRINLATSLGSSLVGSLYIIDEPSIGLHPKDTKRLIEVLHGLRNLGNTVIVVEHDEDIMRASDEIIDLGPDAGVFGGEVVAKGTFNELLKAETWTGKYLSKRAQIEIPKKRISPKKFLHIKGAREHNLKNINVSFPLQMLTVITGVSGSGKSTLVKDILLPAVRKEKDIYGDKLGEFSSLDGDLDAFQEIQYISQKPIGLSSRSNPVTYIKAYDEIRKLFASQALSKQRGYQTKHYSFNVDGGRCPNCKGEGTVKIEMQFMADVDLICDDCAGKRFQKELLEVNFEGKNIHDVLTMSIDEAITFFKQYQQNKISDRLQPLQDVGMGYVSLGQSSSTLSGGEAQRIKLATFLLKGAQKTKTLFLFDEPTTGLHMHDIKKLVGSFRALIERGHSLIVIEHNVSLIEQADHIIDLGPEGGINGGHLLATGTPEEINVNKKSSLYKLLLND